MLNPGTAYRHLWATAPGSIWSSPWIREGVMFRTSGISRIWRKGVIGEIAVDSIYTPVLKVNFNVESTRVGQSIDTTS